MEKKKYIHKDEINSIMDCLIDRAMRNIDKVSLETTVRTFCGDIMLDVTVRSKKSYKTLAHESYIIVENLCNEFDISEDVFDAGLLAWEHEPEVERQTEVSSDEVAA